MTPIIVPMSVTASTQEVPVSRVSSQENFNVSVGLEIGYKGEKGDTGVGIASVRLNNDYTLTITLTDGTAYTTDSIRGEQGIQGEQGIPGQKGDKGDPGEPGAKGADGATGAKGDKGDKGDTGDTGPKGDTGETGPVGPKGDKGDTGDDYVLTAADKSDIADIVYGLLTDADNTAYGGA